MKEEAVKPDPLRGMSLLFRFIRLYPFNRKTNEILLNKIRLQHISTVRKYIWDLSVFEFLNREGYYINFEFSSLSRFGRYNIINYSEDAFCIVEKIIDYLNKIEKTPKNDVYLKNREFISLRLFFKALYYLLFLKEEKGGWKQSLKTKDNTITNEFSHIFGFIHYDFIEYIMTPEEFCSIINEILKELGYEAFSLSNDGILRYFGITVKAEEKRRVYDLLSVKKFDNVIEDLDKIYEHLSSNNYSDALANCRKALESFYKRFLINHRINILHDGKHTEDGIITNLAETVKQNISNLFKFPAYSKNLDNHGYFHLIESSKFIISGLANPSASHGKSTPPKIKLSDIKVAESFLILIINTFLPFEK